MLQVTHLSKQYKGGNKGIHDVSFSIERGVIGLLGPNGAGKSTLIRMLATIMKPSGGLITWNGINILKEPRDYRNRLGYLPQDFGVYPHLNAREFLHYIAAAKGMHRKVAARKIEELLLLINLSEEKSKPLSDFSGGMKQRVGIAQALLNDPAILIVDEPTVGLDPEERARFRSFLSELSGDRIVILSTHIVSDVESVANELYLINKGSILVNTKTSEMVERMNGKVWQMEISSAEFHLVRDKYLVTNSVRNYNQTIVRIAGEKPSSTAIPVMPNLEDAYLFYLKQPS